MNPIVQAACDLAVSSAFGSGASYRPIGPSADTAFSGSAVLELEVTLADATGDTVASTEKVVLKHSSVRRLHPSFATENASSSTQEPFANKKYAAAIKTDKSSRNECAFLEAYWEGLLFQNFNKTRIPKVLFARDHPTQGVTLLLESLSSFGKDGGSLRIEVIPIGPQLDSALEWLANFHAAFLPQSVNPNALDRVVLAKDSNAKDQGKDETAARSTTTTDDETPSSFLWSVGTHLSLEKRSPTELNNLDTDLAAFVERFQGEHEYFRTSATARQQGKRIQAVAKGVAAALHPDNNPTFRTMVHGDYKQGNMFFDAAVAAKEADTSSGIAVFDWQWTGPGIAATDVIYLCVMAVSDEALDDYETNILKPYHNYLIQAMNRGQKKDDNGKPQYDYPYERLVREFQLAAIDIQRWLAGSRYKSMSPESVRKAQEKVDVNHGIFRRSIERLVWIFQTVDDALEAVESGKIQLITTPSN